MKTDSKKENSTKYVDKTNTDFYTMEELSLKSGVSERSLRQAVADGKLKAVKKFTRWFVFHNDFIDFLNSKE